MYKDKEKQKEAQREWVRQKRAAKGSTKQGSTSSSTSDGSVTKSDGKGGWTLEPLIKPERTPGGHIRVSKPGDADYELEHADQPRRNCKYCGKQLEHSVLTCCYQCAIDKNSPTLSRTSSTKGARL